MKKIAITDCIENDRSNRDRDHLYGAGLSGYETECPTNRKEFTKRIFS